MKFLIGIVFYTVLTLVSGYQCPPPELVQPCKCTDEDGLTLQCWNLTNKATLEDINRRTGKIQFKKLHVFQSTLPLPTMFLLQKRIQSLDLVESNFTSDFLDVNHDPFSKMSHLSSNSPIHHPMPNSMVKYSMQNSILHHLQPNSTVLGSLSHNSLTNSALRNSLPISTLHHLLQNSAVQLPLPNSTAPSSLPNSTAQNSLTNPTIQQSLANSTVQHSSKNPTIQHSVVNSTVQHSSKNPTIQHSVVNLTVHHSSKNLKIQYSVVNSTVQHSLKNPTIQHSLVNSTVQHSSKNPTIQQSLANSTVQPLPKNPKEDHYLANKQIHHSINRPLNSLTMEAVHLYDDTFTNGISWKQFLELRHLRFLLAYKVDITHLDYSFRLYVSKTLERLHLWRTGTVYLDEEVLEGFTELIDVRIQECMLTELKRSYFARPAKIQIMYFDGNQIQSLPDDIFDQMPDLRSVDLSKNHLSAVLETVFGSVYNHLGDLSLSGNPLICNCNISWIVPLQGHRYLDGYCTEPASLKERSLVTLRNGDFEFCKENTTET